MIAALATAYVGAYLAFYARGVAESMDDEPFFYAPYCDIAAHQGPTPQHEFLWRLFHPLNRIHADYFGGRNACTCFLRLS
jgi:hypothetical protein